MSSANSPQGVHSTEVPQHRPVNPAVSFLTLKPMASAGVRDIGLLVLRIFTLLLVFHGVHKAQGYDGFLTSLEKNDVGSVAPQVFGVLVVAGQILLPIFMFIGLFTRWCGLLQVVLFLFIIGAVNIPNGGWMSEHGGFAFESSLLFLVMGVVLFMTGPGRLSVDHKLNRSEGRGNSGPVAV